MPLTPEDVKSRTFTTVRLREGYDMNEVDHFLDEVEAELGRLLGQQGTAKTDGAPTPETEPAAEAKPEVPADPEEGRHEGAPAVEGPGRGYEEIRVTTAAEASAATTRLLERAINHADQTVAEANEEAERILAEARRQADEVERASKERAEKAEQETQAKRSSVLAKLEQEKADLAEEVENLRAFEREYRSRLKSYFSEQLDALDGHGAPSGPAPGASATSPSPAD